MNLAAPPIAPLTLIDNPLDTGKSHVRENHP